MRFIAVTRFADLRDGRRVYEAGDPFPRPGLEVSRERIAELAGSDNRAGYPLIRALEEPETGAADGEGREPAPASRPAQGRPRGRKKG